VDVYLSTVSNRLNDVMKQLTVIATIFLPLTYVTGYFGQNFPVLVHSIGGWPAFLVLGVALEAACALGLLLLFRKRGWF
jgi:magnesium transporter